MVTWLNHLHKQPIQRPSIKIKKHPVETGCLITNYRKFLKTIDQRRQIVLLQ